MSPARVKCDVYQELTTGQEVCNTHGFRFSRDAVVTDRCPLGRLEDIEARLDSIEDAMHEIARAMSVIAGGRP